MEDDKSISVCPNGKLGYILILIANWGILQS